MNWLDIVVILYIAFGTIRGYTQGLIKAFFSMAGFLIVAFIAKIFYPAVASLITATSVGSKIQTTIGAKVEGIIRGALSSGEIVEGQVEGVVELFKLPSFIEKPLVQEISQSSAVNNSIENVISNMTTSLTTICINIISFLILFAAIKIALMVAVAVLDTIAKLPVLHQINKGGGILFGFIGALITIMVIFAVLTPFVSLNSEGLWSKAVEGSLVAKKIYYNNFVLRWMSYFLSNLIK